MPLTGKYDFKGIKKLGARGLKLALGASPYTAWLLKAPLLDQALEMLANWLAGKGLILFNLGAVFIEGEFDQHSFDKALDDGIRAVETQTVTPDKGKAIDDAVRAAARKYFRITNS